MTDISHNSKIKEISQFCLPRPGTSEFANPKLPGLPDRTGLKATNHHIKSF